MSSSKIPNLVASSECYKYAEAVLSGEIVACVKVRQACQRFLDDLNQWQTDPKYPWAFDAERAYRPIDFIENFIKPTKGDYDRMKLLPWQHFVIGNIYGWVDKKTGYRRFREALVLVGSGNGKSTLVTGLASFAISKDGERGAEVYCLANSKQQARIVFNSCKEQIEASPLLSKHFRTTFNGIYFDRTNGSFEPRATDSKNLDGLNVHMGIFDEIQEYRDYKLINVIKKKGKKRRQPLFVYISTLGTVLDGPLMDYYVLGGKILSKSDAISQRAADRMFVYIAEIDEKDEPDDSSCWIKANPSLGPLLLLDDLIDEWERCKLVPAERSDFINKQLNVFTAVDELSFLTPETIFLNNRSMEYESLRGRRCYGGFDLAETEDFTSACLEFPLGGNDFFVMVHSWVPMKKVKEDHEKLDWQRLVKNGDLTIVDKDYVEYEHVLEWFLEKRELYRLESIGFDPAKAFMMVQSMREKGFVMNEVRMGELTLTAPLDNLKERFIDGNIVHNNNTMLNWYLENVKLTKRGPNATYLPTKQNKYRKIDGFMALLTAHTEYLRRNPLFVPVDKKLTTVIKLEI